MKIQTTKGDLTREQIANLAAIYAQAKPQIEAHKAKAVKECDFDTSLAVTFRQAQVEQFLRERGVTLE